MKINGVQVTQAEELLVLPRSNGDDIVFRAIPVAIADEFDAMVPLPVPPMIQKKGGKQQDFEDKEYVKTMDIRGDKRFALMVIRSLAPSNIEWETVNLKDPSTWTKWDKELMDAGLSETECNRIVATVMAANSLDESKIKEARESFLRGQEA